MIRHEFHQEKNKQAKAVTTFSHEEYCVSNDAVTHPIFWFASGIPVDRGPVDVKPWLKCLQIESLISSVNHPLDRLWHLNDCVVKFEAMRDKRGARSQRKGFLLVAGHGISRRFGSVLTYSQWLQWSCWAHGLMISQAFGDAHSCLSIRVKWSELAGTQGEVNWKVRISHGVANDGVEDQEYQLQIMLDNVKWELEYRLSL